MQELPQLLEVVVLSQCPVLLSRQARWRPQGEGTLRDPRQQAAGAREVRGHLGGTPASAGQGRIPRWGRHSSGRARRLRPPQ